MDNLQFPIGKFTAPTVYTNELRKEWIQILKETPKRLTEAIANLTPEQLNTPYRPNGWTVLQVVHHLADSHMNSFIRFKLALTENEPTIKPYKENLWANLDDSRNVPSDISLQLLEALHMRWVHLLESISENDYNKMFLHPELNKKISLNETLALYAWHSQHHLAHITSLKVRMNW
ncbi:putative metal-dependent hydrolase [Heyndrickxia sporothermodurans]|nr:putative metal-dependent hydrolase [Heyndrickxia sporothermodurans]